MEGPPSANSTGSGSLQTWMGGPRSPSARRKAAEKAASNLSPAQESEEIADGVGEYSSDSDEEGSDGDEWAMVRPLAHSLCSGLAPISYAPH